MRPLLPVVLSLALASVAAAQNKPRQELKEITPESVDTAVYQRLKYRYIGPEGNRVTSVAGVPGDPNTYYAGAASGGLWKSTDGGIHWDPVFDKRARVLGRRDRGGAVRPERRLGGHGRAVHPQPHLRRLGNVPVDRRRQDLVARGAREHGTHRAHRRRSHEPGSRLRCVVRLRLWPAAGARHLSHGGRRQDTGSACFSSTTPLARVTS